MKIPLSILRTETGSAEEKRRRTYKEGTAAEKIKDAGVKKSFIFAMAQCSQKNYENVRHLWIAVRLNDSCQFPCTWCFAEKYNLEEREQLRSI